MTGETPRTDAALITVMHRLTAMQHVEGKAVSVEFARQLETELAQAKFELNAMRVSRDEWKKAYVESEAMRAASSRHEEVPCHCAIYLIDGEHSSDCFKFKAASGKGVV